MIFDVEFNLMRKASERIAFLVVALNDLDVLAADV